MKVYLERKGYSYSNTTVHKYMNTELGLRSVVRPKKPGYEHGNPHKVFDNKLKQNFTADEINRKWCTDFTYLFLANHEVRYNCTIIDLHDRSVIASITDRNITSDLVILRSGRSEKRWNRSQQSKMALSYILTRAHSIRPKHLPNSANR